MKKNSQSNIFYKLKKLVPLCATVLLLGLLTWALNVIGIAHHHRLDLTRDKRHTLADGTRRILGKVDKPVTITFFFSVGEKHVPQAVKDYALRAGDLLREFELAGNGQVEFQRVSAKPESKIEDTLQMVGIEPLFLADEQHYYYCGIEVACVDRSVIVRMDPNKEKTLEYDLARAVQRVTRPEKKRIGILSSHAVMGASAMKGSPFRRRTSVRPWMFVRELKKDYDVQAVQMDFGELPDNLDLLLLIHPKGLKPNQLYLIDQYLMRGGRIVAFLDPMSALDVKGRGFGAAPSPEKSRSDLGPLLAAWGVEYDVSKVVVDPGFSIQKRLGVEPAFLDLDTRAMGREDVIGSTLAKLMLPYAGGFRFRGADGIEKSSVVTSSKVARLLPRDDVLTKRDLNPLLKATQATQVDLVLKLSGRFTSAFSTTPDGIQTAAPHLSRAAQASAIVLFSDSDMLEDRIWTQRYFNQHTQKESMIVRNDNNRILQNAVDQLAGGDDLIAIRSRADLPVFTRVNQMWQDADEKLRDELLKWQQEAEETDRSLANLRKQHRGSQEYIESPEERREKERLSKKRLEITENIKRLRRDRRRRIDQLGARILWLNVAGVPMLVALFGIGVGLYRRFY